LELTLPALLITKKSMSIFLEENISLKEHNTMQIDCVARYFLRADNQENLIEGIKYAKEKKIQFLVIGGGSNIILPQRYEGMVILVTMDKYEGEEKEEKIIFQAEAGVTLPDAAVYVNRLLGKGLEWAGGVPGTIGGAIRGNAGAFGDFMTDCVSFVEVLNTDNFEIEKFDKKGCQFGYRESIFKKKKNYIILRAEMEFIKKEEDKKLEEYLEYRKVNHPTEPSSGSIFKNPVVKDEFYAQFKETEKFKKMGFVPMRFLIEECGLKGEKRGGAKISEKHANFIINENNATKEDIKELLDLVKKEIKEHFNIEVHEEVEII
jgi:UDP-N-acetylmuramate dehydrogenase